MPPHRHLLRRTAEGFTEENLSDRTAGDAELLCKPGLAFPFRMASSDFLGCFEGEFMRYVFRVGNQAQVADDIICPVSVDVVNFGFQRERDSAAEYPQRPVE